MSQVRILHCVFNPEVGGLQNGLVNLINRLRAPDLTHAVCAYAPAPVGNGSFYPRLRNPDCRVFQLHRTRGNDPRLVRQLVRVIREYRPHVVHTRNWPTYVEGAVAATLGGAGCLVHGEHGTPFFDGWKRRWLYRLLARRTRLVVTVSDSLGRLYRQTCGRWAARARTIHNGVDDVRFSPPADRAAAKAALGLPADAPVVGCVGRLVPIKGFDLLLRAVPAVLKELPRAQFVIVGPGPEEKNLTELADKLGVRESVRFLGDRPDPDACYRAMDLYVSTSRWEGISNTILEALACGVPVVGTAVGGTPEILGPAGPAGTLVLPEDVGELARAVLACLADPRGLEQRREAARETVRRRFSLAVMLQNYESMYRECAAG